MVVRVVGPRRPREGVVAIGGALDLGDGEDGFEGLADADDGDELHERFAEAADEGLPGGAGLVGGLGEEVEVELVG